MFVVFSLHGFIQRLLCWLSSELGLVPFLPFTFRCRFLLLCLALFSRLVCFVSFALLGVLLPFALRCFVVFSLLGL